ncbi:MAG: hypothetical protein B7Z73_16370, partial [Planctomycetia bacterium 21-64-5]
MIRPGTFARLTTRKLAVSTPTITTPTPNVRSKGRSCRLVSHQRGKASSTTANTAIRETNRLNMSSSSG